MCNAHHRAFHPDTEKTTNKKFLRAYITLNRIHYRVDHGMQEGSSGQSGKRFGMEGKEKRMADLHVCFMVKSFAYFPDKKKGVA